VRARNLPRAFAENGLFYLFAALFAAVLRSLTFNKILYPIKIYSSNHNIIWKATETAALP
jgi:hypothetical protein